MMFSFTVTENDVKTRIQIGCVEDARLVRDKFIARGYVVSAVTPIVGDGDRDFAERARAQVLMRTVLSH